MSDQQNPAPTSDDDGPTTPPAPGAETDAAASVPPAPPAPPLPPAPPAPPAPVNGAPAEPTYSAPAAPAYGAPAEPTYSAPAPAYGAPPYSAPAPAPGAPGYSAPGYSTPGHDAASPYDPAAPYGAGFPGYVAQARTNVLAVISLVASIAGFLLVVPVIGPITAVIIGHIALAQVKRTGERGQGMALAGTIIGWAGVGVLLLLAIAIVLGVAIARSSRYGV